MEPDGACRNVAPAVIYSAARAVFTRFAPRHAPSPLFFTARGTPVSLFPYPQKGNGAHPISGLPEIGHVQYASRVNPTCGGVRGPAPAVPFGEPLRSGPPRAVRRRAPACEAGCASRRSTYDARCRRTAPCSIIATSLDDALCEQGAHMIRPLERAGISSRSECFGVCRCGHRERVATSPPCCRSRR
jgi:hypothetical protein